MITKVKLFLRMKNESIARVVGFRRLRQAPKDGQQFEIAVDGRPVRARITHFTTVTEPVSEKRIPDVYAEEI